MSGELQLALAYELTPENAPRFAADIVAQSASQGITLDYSADSLGYLDSVMESLRAQRVSVEQVGEVLLAFGCYLGECIVRSTGARWVVHPGSLPIAVRSRDGATLDPVSYAFTTLAGGATFTQFYQTLV
ncbi:MAG: DUF6278 family protein [Microbacteriaceae bacterium]